MPDASAAKQSPRAALAHVAEETRKMIERYPFLRVQSSAYRGKP